MPCLSIPRGVRWRKFVSGEGSTEEGWDLGLLSREALVRGGVGGSRKESVSTSVSIGRSGDDPGDEGLEVYGEEDSDEGGVSNRGRNANLGFSRWTWGLFGRWAR